MRRFHPLRFAGFLVLVAVAITVAAFAVMLLWNWLIPPLAGWHSLSFIQALGLLVLCRILFGGFRGRIGPWGHGRFRHMTAEERERFRQEMRARCGWHEQPREQQG
jgi:hypothetical protein